MKHKSRVKVAGFVREKQSVRYYQRLGETVRIKARTWILHPGQRPQYCYYIRSGRVFAGVTDQGQSERILFLYEKDSLFLEDYLLTGGRSPMFYVTDTDVVVQKITYPELIQSMKNNFTVTLDVIQAMASFGETALNRVIDNVDQMAAIRICNLFFDMAELFGESAKEGICLNVKIRQEIIGKLTGLHRVTVVKELNKLKNHGLLTMEDGCYCITDMDRLTRYRDDVGLKNEEGM